MVAPWVAEPDNCIFFYDKYQPFYEFTNFSPHKVQYEGKMYPTSEHLFQSFKFTGPNKRLAERIRLCGDSPSAAFNEAQRLKQYVRHDWKDINIRKMKRAIRCKFEQHDKLKILLLTTGNAYIVEDSPTDYFWGIGAMKTGRNELGEALMRLRKEFLFENDPMTMRRKSAQGPYGSSKIRGRSVSVQGPVPTGIRGSLESARGMLLAPKIRTRSSSAPRHPLLAASAIYLCEVCKVKPRWVDADGRLSSYCSRTCVEVARVNMVSRGVRAQATRPSTPLYPTPSQRNSKHPRQYGHSPAHMEMDWESARR
ncbi:DUF1768-domain-containing protein [Suillus lakei]|nr:DUF1768-domain-containing protein [Suillus lakei]